MGTMKRFHLPHPHLPNLPHPHLHHPCPITGKNTSAHDRIPLHAINHHILEMIYAEHPDTQSAKWFSRHAINDYQTCYTQDLIEKDRGELSELEREVIASVQQREILSLNASDEIADNSTFAARAADTVANIGGSWIFVLGFMLFIISWMSVNTYWFFNLDIFDPYPFILLNLALSCLAAIQAPIIMMSQNRQGTKDRMRDENEYKIALKAELEIRNLNSKLDLHIEKQWSHLLELQEMQLEILQQIQEAKMRSK